LYTVTLPCVALACTNCASLVALASVLAHHSVLLCAALSTITTAFVQRLRWARGSYDMLSLNLGTLIRSKHLSFRQKASWLMLGYMPIVAMCIVITIVFRFTWSNSRALDMYSWIPLCIHFVLARYTALHSPGAGHVAPLYLMWRDSTAFFTYFSIHLYTLWTAVTRTKASFVTTSKVASNDAEAGRWHPLCWWNVVLSVVTGTLLVWLTDASVCNSLTTFGAFLITVYIFISNWDVMSVLLSPMTRWPLDPYANNTSIVVEPYISSGDALPMFNSRVHDSSSTTATALSSAQPSELSSPTVAVTAVAAKHTAVQQQQHPMAPLATVTASTATVTAAAAVAAVTQATTTSTAAVTAPTAAPAVRRSSSFMRWYSGLRGVFILMIVTSHIQIGLSNSGVKPNEDQWGAWIGLPTWLSAILWPLSASHSGAHIGIRALTFCTGYGLSMSCSRRNMSFSTMKEYTGFVKTRLHR
jgi:hypothetical protein